MPADVQLMAWGRGCHGNPSPQPESAHTAGDGKQIQKKKRGTLREVEQHMALTETSGRDTDKHKQNREGNKGRDYL